MRRIVLAFIFVVCFLSIYLISIPGAHADLSNTTLMQEVPVKASTQSDLEANPVTMTVYVTNSITNDISVIDAITNNVITTVPVGINPVAVSVNPSTNKIYVANQDSNSVSVIDGNTNEVITTINNIPEAMGLDINNVTIKSM